MSEYLENCCFCVSLYRGTVMTSLLIMTLCPLNVVMSLVEVNSARHVVAHYIFATTNVAIFFFVLFTTCNIKKKRPYSWYVGFAIFGFVLCQIIAVLAIIADNVGEKFKFHAFLVTNTLVAISLLFYFVFLVTSIFYKLTEEGGAGGGGLLNHSEKQLV